VMRQAAVTYQEWLHSDECRLHSAAGASSGGR